MAKLFGRAVITADGQILNTKMGASLTLGGVKRNARPGSNTTGGFTEELENSELECEVEMDGNLSLASIAAIEDASILFECDTGQNYLIEGAYSSDPPSITEGEGYAKCKFGGPEALEIS
ncbi:MAG: phage tail tube protein [Caulobacteraceae bacterium]